MHDPLNVYRGRYKEFIENIMKERPLNERLDYCDNHHIVPRCTFSDKSDITIDDKDNLIYLTYREHFIAHKLLAEENPHIKGLIYAHWRMCNNHPEVLTPELYASARTQFMSLVSGESHYLYHARISEETKQKISKTRKSRGIAAGERNYFYGKHYTGDTNPFYGKSHTEETKRHLSEVHRGKSLSDEHKNTISIALKGRIITEDHKSKISNSMKGKVRNYHLICDSCGREFIGHTCNRKYCDICRK